jgi:hypothetical protein
LWEPDPNFQKGCAGALWAPESWGSARGALRTSQKQCGVLFVDQTSESPPIFFVEHGDMGTRCGLGHTCNVQQYVRLQSALQFDPQTQRSKNWVHTAACMPALVSYMVHGPGRLGTPPRDHRSGWQQPLTANLRALTVIVTGRLASAAELQRVIYATAVGPS